MNNTRLLLQSGIGDPYDPESETGVIGKNYCYQVMASAQGFFDEQFNLYAGAGALGVKSMTIMLITLIIAISISYTVVQFSIRIQGSAQSQQTLSRQVHRHGGKSLKKRLLITSIVHCL